MILLFFLLSVCTIARGAPVMIFGQIEKLDSTEFVAWTSNDQSQSTPQFDIVFEQTIIARVSANVTRPDLFTNNNNVGNCANASSCVRAQTVMFNNLCYSDCQYSEWSAWVSCTCANPRKTRSRSILIEAGPCGGAKCDEPPVLNDEIICAKTTDCLESLWSGWSACSDTCRGMRSFVEALCSGGRTCSGPRHDRQRLCRWRLEQKAGLRTEKWLQSTTLASRNDRAAECAIMNDTNYDRFDPLLIRRVRCHLRLHFCRNLLLLLLQVQRRHRQRRCSPIRTLRSM